MSSNTAVSAVVYLNNRLNESIAELSTEFSSVGLLDASGQYVPDVTTNYVSSATTVKEGLLSLDLNLYSVGTTYATLAYVNEQISTVKASAPSTLDTLAEIASSIANNPNFATSVVSSITAARVLAGANESTILTNLNTEIARASAAESTLTSLTASEASRAAAAEAVISTNISGETVRATEAENVLLSSIQLEVTNRIQLVNNLQTFLQTTIADLSGNIRTALAAETARAIAAEQVISTSIVTEQTRATDAETGLQSTLNAYSARALAAEQAISTSIVAETTRALAAESALSGRATSIEGTYIKKDGTVAFTSTVNAGSNLIQNVATPSSDSDAANKSYVDTKIASLGSVFEYVSTVNVATVTDLSVLSKKDIGDVYKVVGSNYVSTNASTTKFVKDGDFVVRSQDDWDIINNKDISLSGTTNRIALSGNAFDEYILNISPNYVGQNTITTLGTVATGTWQGTVVQTAYGGLGFSNYASGDLLVGTAGGSLSKLSIGSNGTMLRSDGSSLSWIPATTGNIAMTDATNFSTSTHVQQACDYLYDRMQKRHILQFVVGNSSDYEDPLNANSNLLSGKANFINYTSTGTVYLPPTSATIADNAVIRLIHNGEFGDNNMFVKRRNAATSNDETVVEAAPHDCMVLIYKASSNAWMVGLGI